jgi:hypothetical protein
LVTVGADWQMTKGKWKIKRFVLLLSTSHPQALHRSSLHPTIDP